ncbi:hypothetical protein OAN96_01255 [Candidatus Gracilibacteria bacterium]|nr:hypothetical protein [Candidatus Gracilibacteria bacterium]
MGKEKDFFVTLMRSFVSGSIYLIMLIIAAFIFYETIVLLVFVFTAITTHFSNMDPSNLESMRISGQSGIALAEQVLNIVTFILVLVKSFKILVSYSKNHHIAVKDLVEISIIALLMEVVFNFGLHDITTNILFAVLGTALVIVYTTIPYFRKSTKKLKF